MKQCVKCKLDKDLSEFPVQKRTKNGVYSVKRRSECKHCYNEYMKDYLKGNSKHKTRVKKGKIERRIFVKDLKLSTGCNLCGYNKCASSLHYHHLDPKDKEFEIGWAMQHQLSEEKILVEISKCQLLCANCHGEIEEAKNMPL